jgi:hypothetical protein
MTFFFEVLFGALVPEMPVSSALPARIRPLLLSTSIPLAKHTTITN